MSAPTFFVTAVTGTADLLAAELAALGIADAREVLGGVSSASPLPDAYRACLWSRVGLRVLWRIAEFPVADADELYRRLREIDWSSHMDVGDTLAWATTAAGDPKRGQLFAGLAGATGLYGLGRLVLG